MAALLTVNGIELPPPKRGLSLILTQAVNNGRNANAEVIGERVGRRNNKYNNLEWPALDHKQWSQIVSLFSEFFVTAKIYSMESDDWLTIKMYPGDFSAEPYWIDRDPTSSRYMMPTLFLNCKVNIIDCGILD